MKNRFKFAALLTGAIFAPVSFAQQDQGPGYDIAWGVQAVPLSPTLSALIALMMGLATWAFMRKRRGTGFMAAVAAVALGTMGYNSDSIAIPDPHLLTINSQTGSTFVACPTFEGQSVESSEIQQQVELSPTTVGTTIPGGVTLTRVQSNFILPTSDNGFEPSGASIEQCTVGTRVTPASPCALFCPIFRL